MDDYPLTSTSDEGLTVFITSEHYIIGAGETLTDLDETGEWLATTTPVDIEP